MAVKVKAEVRRTGHTFKQTVNDLLLAGLTRRAQVRAVKPFKVHARAMGLRPGLNFDKISELLDQLEGPFHR